MARSLRPARFAAGILAAALLAPASALACACGCGVFDVATGSLFASGEGTTLFTEYDFLNQRENWSGTSKAPAASNADKKIRTNFFTLGADYMWNRDWSLMADVPIWQRHFETGDGMGGTASFDHVAQGDLRLRAAYTGLSDDLSTGLTFGVKLPTGDSGYVNFDPDTEIGTGSTGILLGAYYQGALDQDADYIWYGQVSADIPVLQTSAYRPGWEADGALGVYYNSWNIGSGAKIAPVFQIIVSHRGSDSGAAANPDDTGYDRLFAAPGVEFDIGRWKVYADFEQPVYMDMRGNQLVAPEQYKLIVSYAL